jgi:hypothetical protein
MRHVNTIAITALVTAIISSWGTTMMVVHSSQNTGSARIASQVRTEPAGPRNVATTEEMQTETSWTRWPSVTDF